jgi:hypothetical protein
VVLVSRKQVDGFMLPVRMATSTFGHSHHTCGFKAATSEYPQFRQLACGINV